MVFSEYNYSQSKAIPEKVMSVLSVVQASDFVLTAKTEHRSPEIASWALIYVEKGKLSVLYNGDKTILEQNSMLLIHESKYSLEKIADNEDASVICLDFISYSQLLDNLVKKKLFVSVHNRKYLTTLYREYQMSHAGESQVMGKINREFYLLGGDQTVLNRLELFLIEITREELRRNTPSIISKDNISNRTVIRIINMLEERLYDKISLDEISGRISYSKSYLSRLFHSVCGYSIMEYYMMIKIEEAKRLIREYSFNFSQISERLRFDNPHYFSVAFKRVTGMTPSEYSRAVRRD